MTWVWELQAYRLLITVNYFLCSIYVYIFISLYSVQVTRAMRPGLLLYDCSILKVLLRHNDSIKTLRDRRLKDIVGNTFVAIFRA